MVSPVYTDAVFCILYDHVHYPLLFLVVVKGHLMLTGFRFHEHYLHSISRMQVWSDLIYGTFMNHMEWKKFTVFTGDQVNLGSTGNDINLVSTRLHEHLHFYIL